MLDNQWIKHLVTSRSFQLAILLLTSMGYSLAIFTGLFGSPVGSSNFSTIWVWLVWWGVFVILFLPFFGRLWCAICPIPTIGETVQRRSLIGGSGGRKIKLSPKFFPTRYQGMWISNFLFFLFAIFAGKLTTDPRLTGITLLLLFIGSTATALYYRERSFCRHLCPIGGSIAMYSLLNPIELRVIDKQVCQTHHDKECIFGNEESFGCPWMVYPGTLDANSNCGLCMECIRACSLDNISLNLRLGKDDLLRKTPKLEETVRSFLLFGIALMYPLIFLGTSNSLTKMANFSDFQEFLTFTTLIAASFFVLIPAIVLLPVFLLMRHRQIPTNSGLLHSTVLYTLPLGLSSLIGFTLDILSRNMSYAINTLNDPFGVGWKLFGIDPLEYDPFYPQIIAILSIVILIIGSYSSSKIIDRVARTYFYNIPSAELMYRVLNYLILTFFTFFILLVQFGEVQL